MALNTLIEQLTRAGDYGEDLVEVSLPNSDAAGGAYGVIPLIMQGNQPQVRKVEYVTVNDQPLVSVLPRYALDQAGRQLSGVFYRSGTNLIVHASSGFTSLRMGYYRQFKPLTEADTHWMLEIAPMALLNGTIGRIFAMTGDDQSAAYYERLYQVDILAVRRSRTESEDT